MIHAQSKLQLKNGIVIGVTNPAPGEGKKIQNAIDEALLRARLEGIKGALVTPFVLAMVEKLTKGASLEANIALITNNAKVAAQIACHHSELLKSEAIHSIPSTSSSTWLSSLSFPSSSSSTDKRSSTSLSESNSVYSEINDRSIKKISMKNKSNNILIFGAAIVDVIASPSGMI
jgi:hypothetical protein